MVEANSKIQILNTLQQDKIKFDQQFGIKQDSNYYGFKQEDHGVFGSEFWNQKPSNQERNDGTYGDDFWQEQP